MKKIILITLPLLIISCISFRFQRMSWSHDEKTDTLKIFQEYEGIYTAEGKVSDQELEQYEKLMKGTNSYFFHNWIFEYPGRQIDETLAEEDLKPIERKLLVLLSKSVKVENGDFYKNTKGELCGWQKVTVGNTSELLSLGNKVIREYHEMKALDDASKKYMLKQPPEGKYIDIVNNQLMYRHPVLYEDYHEFKEKLIKALLKGGDKKYASLVNLLKSNTQVNFKDSFLEVTVGKPFKKVNVIEAETGMPEDIGPYTDAFMKKVAEDHEIKDSFDENIKTNFLK